MVRLLKSHGAITLHHPVGYECGNDSVMGSTGSDIDASVQGLGPGLGQGPGLGPGPGPGLGQGSGPGLGLGSGQGSGQGPGAESRVGSRSAPIFRFVAGDPPGPMSVIYPPLNYILVNPLA